MTPTENKTVAEFLLADFEYEMQTTLRLLEAVPAAKLDYRPDGKAKNAIELARHIALEDEWLMNCIADGVFIPPPDGSDACGLMTPADTVACYKARVPAAVARLRALTGEQLGEVIDLFGMVQMPRVNFIAMAAKHSVHHRGQLSTYIRPMGGQVPGIYGPSADTQAAHA